MQSPQNHIRNRLDPKRIAHPLLKRFPSRSERHEYAHDVMNRARERIGLRANIELRPMDDNVDHLSSYTPGLHHD